MKELSLNVLDIVQNSITAGAKNIDISLVEDDNGYLTIKIKDDGCGMTKEVLENVINPFYTTRKTRKVGMGIPLFKLAAEQTGGSLSIESVTKEESSAAHGTTITASFDTNHMDFTPVGDIVSTMCTIIQGHPEIDYNFLHKGIGFEVKLETAELRQTLGDDIPLSEFEIINWISEYLKEQYNE